MVLDDAFVGFAELGLLGLPELLHLGRVQGVGVAPAGPPQLFAPAGLIKGPLRRLLEGHILPFTEDRVVDRDVAEMLRPFGDESQPVIVHVRDEVGLVLPNELYDVGGDELGGAGDQAVAGLIQRDGDARLLEQAEDLFGRGPQMWTPGSSSASLEGEGGVYPPDPSATVQRCPGKPHQNAD
jgi:hypothetical protein